MRVGDKVIRKPETFGDREEGERFHAKLPMPGRVVYVHPKGRFHVVEFDTPGGRIRESFPGTMEK